MAAKRMMFFMAALPHARLEGFWVETSWWNNATCEDPKASPSMVSVRKEIVLDGETCKKLSPEGLCASFSAGECWQNHVAGGSSGPCGWHVISIFHQAAGEASP